MSTPTEGDRPPQDDTDAQQILMAIQDWLRLDAASAPVVSEGSEPATVGHFTQKDKALADFAYWLTEYIEARVRTALREAQG